jgi:hypothetical protein
MSGQLGGWLRTLIPTSYPKLRETTDCGRI